MLKKIIFIIISIFALLLPAAAEGEVRLPVVMYHHLSPKPELLGKYVLEVAQLERDLVYLRDNGYQTITAAQLAAWCDGDGELPEKPVMITFDDAFESVYVYAVPLLEKYGMKAAVMVIGAAACEFTETPDHNLDYSHMDWAEIAELDAGDTVEIQCHTWDMHRLTPRSGCGRLDCETSAGYHAALADDIGRFQSEAAARLGRTCEAIAFPFGVFSQETLEVAEELGFRVAFTCSERVNRLSPSPGALLRVDRYNRPNGPSSESFFAKWAE